MKKNNKDYERPKNTEKDWETVWEKIKNMNKDGKRVTKIEKHYKNNKE